MTRMKRMVWDKSVRSVTSVVKSSPETKNQPCRLTNYDLRISKAGIRGGTLAFDDLRFPT
jgi:hypothetical protein